MATKYKEYFDKMVNLNKTKFEEFNILYNRYIKDQDNLQEEFNRDGKAILDLMRDWENKLCLQTEKAGFGNYSTNLSEKFWSEIRKTYPLIDYIGVISKKNKLNDDFLIKKIELFKN